MQSLSHIPAAEVTRLFAVRIVHRDRYQQNPLLDVVDLPRQWDRT
jgi:hypothetical protein